MQWGVPMCRKWGISHGLCIGHRLCRFLIFRIDLLRKDICRCILDLSLLYVGRQIVQGYIRGGIS